MAEYLKARGLDAVNLGRWGGVWESTTNCVRVSQDHGSAIMVRLRRAKVNGKKALGIEYRPFYSAAVQWFLLLTFGLGTIVIYPLVQAPGRKRRNQLKDAVHYQLFNRAG